jgi:hypothetical protein
MRSHTSVADASPVAVAAFATLGTLGIDWTRDAIILIPQGKSGRALASSFHKTYPSPSSAFRILQ